MSKTHFGLVLWVMGSGAGLMVMWCGTTADHQVLGAAIALLCAGNAARDVELLR